MLKKSIGVLLALFLCSTTIQAKEVIPGGESIGIQVSYDGVYVSGTYTFMVNDKQYDPSETIQPNDVIIRINQVRIHTLNDMAEELGKYQNNINTIPIQVIRNHQEVSTTITTAYIPTQRSFRSGLYVKDKITGVGTVTFYDPSTTRYGALGHEILDSDTQGQVSIQTGNIYPADVDGIQKAKVNEPGEKQATIDFMKVLGQVDNNSSIGIYGTYQSVSSKAAITVANRNEIHTGKAVIYTVVHGSKIGIYEIEITKLHKQNKKDQKGIEVLITDPTLKMQTNGIVQGMSGSPIIQDGKIIGALTHVITSDPIRGYGVYIDWMLEESKK